MTSQAAPPASLSPPPGGGPAATERGSVAAHLSLFGLRDPAYYVSARYAPQLRCGLCQEPFDPCEAKVVIEGERVHPHCRAEYEESL